MKTKILLIILILLLIPFIIINTLTIKNKNSLKAIKNEEFVIKVKRSNGNIEKVRFEDYILGVISSEIPVSFEKEAIKAQAVASRSYALTKMNQKNTEYDVVDTVDNQVYQNDQELQAKWQDKYDKNIKKMKNAVKETSYEYLDYEGEVVQAFFFSTSVGKTENSEEVFVKALPYLRSVDSSWDEEASPVFNETNSFKLEEFYNQLDLPYQDKLTFEVLETTSTGRIKKLKINNQEFDGRLLAQKLHLRSNYFKINQTEKTLNITTTGNGHGVGMSQYGANGMAKEGYNYEEILKHYYTGTKIKKIK